LAFLGKHPVKVHGQTGSLSKTIESGIAKSKIEGLANSIFFPRQVGNSPQVEAGEVVPKEKGIAHGYERGTLASQSDIGASKIMDYRQTC
jgi:hypothetical protein